MSLWFHARSIIATPASNYRQHRLTESFYDTAPNEAVEFESRKVVPMRAHVAYQRRPSVKTMLADMADKW
ncbi:hypothetical protein [Rubripirellula obstinata]|uniref:hypothetical protein n=1 Tax=Rubripirellula obstinata TaxID=406547 RepID=UPI001EE49951|nr:hypothetical protein [Rubripirellula obstinata]